MRKIRVGMVFVFGLIWLAGSVPAQKIEMRDGVRIVHNQGKGLWGKKPPVRLQGIRVFGDIDATDEAHALYMPHDMALDGEGNLYILDTGNHRIQEFSPGGAFLRTIGREGQGPGEFNYPTSLDVGGDGSLVVLSPYTQRIQYLAAAGEETGGITLTERFSVPLRAYGSGRLMAAVHRRIPIPGDDDHQNGLEPLIQVMDRECKVLRTFGEPRDFKHGLVNTRANEVSFTASADGSVFVTFLYLNRIEKYSSEGSLIWRADRELAYRADKPLDKGRVETRGSGYSIMAPRMNRCSEGLAVDGSGRLWVITLDRQLEREETAHTQVRISQGAGGSSVSMTAGGEGEVFETDAYRLDVFDTQGVLLGSLPLEHFADAIRISGERVFILDRLRRMQVHEYKIVDTGGR